MYLVLKIKLLVFLRQVHLYEQCLGEKRNQAKLKQKQSEENKKEALRNRIKLKKERNKLEKKIN